jgi:putative nucleotidyltransferase with HDIG domain
MLHSFGGQTMKVMIHPSEIQTLAPMPISVVQLSRLAMDMNADMSAMIRVIEHDEALTANLLKLANSVLSGSREKVMSVKNAVIRIGARKAFHLAVGLQAAGLMRQSCPGYEIREHELWRHSLAAAMAAELLNTCKADSTPGLAFTASLLHDIGKLLLSRHVDREIYHGIREIIQTEKVTFVEAESRLLGTNHAEVGGAVIRHWGFPEELVEAIEYHHNPDSNPNELVDIIYLSNGLAKWITTEDNEEELGLLVSGKVLERQRVSMAQVQSICSDVRERIAEEEKIYKT